MSTTVYRSMQLLRKEGWTVDVVERWLPKINVRKDLYGFGDLLAHHPKKQQFLIVQSTVADEVSRRLKKARALPTLESWLTAGGLFVVHGWKLVNLRWHCMRVAVKLDSCDPIILEKLPRKHRASKWKPTKLFE